MTNKSPFTVDSKLSLEGRERPPDARKPSKGTSVKKTENFALKEAKTSPQSSGLSPAEGSGIATRGKNIIEPHTPKEGIERINKESNERSNIERFKVRHTFDLYKDQIFKLDELKLQRKKEDHPRWRLGDLVQEAIDLFVTKELNKEESNERTK